MPHTRRSLALAGGALVAAGLLDARPGRAAAPFVQPPLPYAPEALAPAIGVETVQLHYGKHHAGYFAKLNELAAGTPFAAMTLDEAVVASAKPEHQAVFNQAGQAWNHIMYWDQFVPGGAKAPSGALAAAIDRDLGGAPAMQAAFTKGAVGVFGSGWFWLVKDGGKLALMGTANGDNPLAHGRTALLGIDVWEHAYYLDYRNRREEHVRTVIERLVNWDVVATRFAA